MLMATLGLNEFFHFATLTGIFPLLLSLIATALLSGLVYLFLLYLLQFPDIAYMGARITRGRFVPRQR